WEHAVATGPRPRVADIFVPALRFRSLMGAGLGAVALLATWGAVQWIPPWVGGLPNPMEIPNRSATTQICMAIGAILGTFSVAVLTHRISRRITYFLLCLISLVLCEVLFLGFQQYNYLFLFMVLLVGGMSASFYGWLPLYLPELFPTRVRA